jgi:hypothetical protein
MSGKPNNPDELLAPAEANDYRRGEHREQGAVPDIYDQDGALRRCVMHKEPSFLTYKWTPVPTQSSRWKLDEMREGVIRRGVIPGERAVRECCLSRGVEVPDLAVRKDFLQL